ncbi:bifunctional aminoglycoside phosphotransferase/ATP-binding protein [Belnapia moabensis]|uniref:bifunctional aminoglycoside phosphotransferase/ATP-binding protein n=1 Tax=Belnapia moabensis TaxID=365533 RepID=UPI00069336C1|nr:AAA family ATPase [Belnapia moabensis]
MSLPAAQAEAGALLARLAGVAAVETHISAVYVGPEDAWKLKKAVALGFLDFSRLTDRERLLRRELALNAPFAPGLYREVVPVTRGADGALKLGGEGEPVEWVLRMAPLRPGDFLDAQEAAGFDPTRLDALGDTVFAMHAALPTRPAPGFRPVIEGNARAALGAGLQEGRVAAWAGAALGWLERLDPWLAARAGEGRVRRCHGDLHLGNLCLWQGRVTPFDALEFDEALATIDTGYDLAFLLMDCEHRLGRAAANRVLNRYAARSGDARLVAALPLWLSLRAMIRAHAEAKRGGDGLAYLDRAEALLHPAPPRLVAVGGLQGTGKTRLARALAPMLGPAPGALVLRSDEIRKRRAGVPPEQRLPPSAYTPEASAAVFAELAAQAEAALRAGHAVVADAVFLRPEERAAIEAAARAAGVRFDGIWLTAPRAVLEARIAARTGDASDASDADVAVLAAAAARDAGPLAWRVLDAAGDPLPAACEALGCNGADPC